jgi:hypothetical protein
VVRARHPCPGEKVWRSTSGTEILRDHQVEDHARVPHIQKVHGNAADDRYEEGAQHADGMTDRVRDESGPRRGVRGGAQLLDLRTDSLMRVDDALRAGGSP